MIKVYESNYVSDIIEGRATIECTDYWPNNWKRVNSIGAYIEEVLDERSVMSCEEISEGLFLVTGIESGCNYYISEDPEKIYKQIKIDKIELL